MSQSGSFNAGSTPPPAGSVLTLTTEDGEVVGPTGGGTIDVIGVAPIFTTGSPGINTVSIEVEDATTTNTGVVELATDAETISGVDATRAVTPAGLTAKLGTQTDHAVAIGNTTTGTLEWSNVGTDGQILIGATGSSPAFATLTSSDNTIIFTPGPNSLDLKASGGSGSGITIDTDSGSAAPIANLLNFNGAVGGNITTTGSSNNLTAAVTGTVDHAVLVGNATGSIDNVGPGTTNTVLLGNTGADPSFGQVPNEALANNSISFTNGASININPNGPVPLGSGVAISVSGTSLHAVQVGAASGGLTDVGPGTTNTVLLGNTGANPSFGKVPNGALTNSSITVNGDANISVSGSPVSLGGAVGLSFPALSQYQLVTANGSGTVQSLPAATGTTGQVLTSNGAGAYPTWQTSTAQQSGAWNPTIAFIGASLQPTVINHGSYYIKIGSIVQVTGWLSMSSKGNGSSGAGVAPNLTPIPFNATYIQYVPIYVVTSPGTPGSVDTVTQWWLELSGGGSVIYYASGNFPAGGPYSLNYASFPNTCAIQMSFSYITGPI